MVDGKRFKVNALDAVMKNSVYKSKFIGEMEFDAVGCGKEWVKDLSYYGNLNFHIYFFEIEKTERDGNVSNFEEQYMCVTGEDGERWFKGKNFEASKLPPGLYDKEARVQDDVTAFMQFEALSEFSPEYIVYDGRDKIDIQLYLNYTDATKSEVESIEFSGDAIGNVTRIDYEKAKYIFQFKSCRDSEEKKELGAKMYEFAETLPKPDFYNVEEKQEEQKPKPDKITVYINGEEVKFDQNPIIKENRTLVPVRAIFEALGAEVEWNEESRTVTAVKDETVITMKINEENMYKNGEKVVLDAAPEIVNSRTLVPVRAIAESFGNEVSWNEAEMRVDVD